MLKIISITHQTFEILLIVFLRIKKINLTVYNYKHIKTAKTIPAKCRSGQMKSHMSLINDIFLNLTGGTCQAFSRQKRKMEKDGRNRI